MEAKSGDYFLNAHVEVEVRSVLGLGFGFFLKSTGSISIEISDSTSEQTFILLIIFNHRLVNSYHTC